MVLSLLLYVISSGVFMNRFTPLMHLTLVVFSFVSPGFVWAQNCETADVARLDAKKTGFKEQLRGLKDRKDNIVISDGQKPSADYKELTRKIDGLEANLADIETRLNLCVKIAADTKDACDKAYSQYSDLNKKLKYPDLVSAKKCLSVDEDSPSELAEIAFYALVESYESKSKPGCENYLKDNKDQAKDAKKELKDINEDIRNDEKKILDIKEDLKKELADLNEKRQALEESAEDSATELLKRIQKRQNDLEQAIIEANSKLIDAKQAFDALPESMNNSLTNYQYEGEFIDLTDNATIDIFCRNKVKKSLNSSKVPGKSKIGIMESSASKGKAKVQELQKIFESCRKRLNNSRSSITAHYDRTFIKAKKAVDDLENYITKQTEELKKTVEEYKTETEKINNRTMKAASLLTQKFQDALENSENKTKALENEIKKNGQLRIGALNTKGSFSRSNAKEVISTHSEMVEIYDKNVGSCKTFQGISDPNVSGNKADKEVEDYDATK